jgi:hypothetical protein
LPGAEYQLRGKIYSAIVNIYISPTLRSCPTGAGWKRTIWCSKSSNQSELYYWIPDWTTGFNEGYVPRRPFLITPTCTPTQQLFSIFTSIDNEYRYPQLMKSKRQSGGEAEAEAQTTRVCTTDMQMIFRPYSRQKGVANSNVLVVCYRLESLAWRRLWHHIWPLNMSENSTIS